MARPQQPELARSAKTDLDPDHVETGLQGQKMPAAGGETGPVPPENQPGHHPPKDQDKPDLDAFAARLGTDPKAPTATNARKGSRAATPAKTTGMNKKAAPAKGSPAKSGPSKATPAKTAAAQATPATATAPTNATAAERPVAAPAPSLEDSVHVAVPQPEPEEHREPPVVSLMLMPLRETVKWLEQLDKTLTERLDRTRR